MGTKAAYMPQYELVCTFPWKKRTAMKPLPLFSHGTIPSHDSQKLFEKKGFYILGISFYGDMIQQMG